MARTSMEEENRPTSLWDVMETYIRDRCTGHGYPRCLTGSKRRRQVWLCISICFTAVMAAAIVVAVIDYYKYPSVVSIVIQQPDEVPFPSVSICPVATNRRGANAKGYVAGFESWFHFFKMDRIPFWEDLIPYMSKEDEELHRLSEMTNFLMQRSSEAVRATIKEAHEFEQLQLGKLNGSDWSHLSTVHTIRRMNDRLRVLPGEGTIWTSQNAGRYLSWLDKAWNGRYHDIHRYLSLGSATKSNISAKSETYLQLFLTRNPDNFRILFNRQPKVKVSNPRKDLKEFIYFKNLTLQTDELPQYGDAAYRFVLQDMLYPYSFKMENIFLSCRFRGRNCLQHIFTTIDPKWRVCFHFNNQVVNKLNEGEPFHLARNPKSSEPLTVIPAGKESGLMIRLKDPLDEPSIPMLNWIDGFVVAIGDSATMPRLDQHFFVPFKTRTDIFLKRTEIRRLDADHGGNCGHDDHFENIFQKYEIAGVYEQSVCQLLLKMFNILSECSCIMSNDILGGIIGYENFSSVYESCSYDTIPCTDYASRLTINQSNTICPPSCREVKLDISASSAPYHEQGSLMAFEKVDVRVDVLCITGHSDKCRVGNFSTIGIFYSSPSVYVIEENLIYSLENFLEKLGFIIGLYMGLSFMSFAEFVELFIDLMRFSVLRRKELRRVSDEKSAHQKNLKTSDSLSRSSVTHQIKMICQYSKEAEMLEQQSELLANELDFIFAEHSRLAEEQNLLEAEIRLLTERKGSAKRRKNEEIQDEV